MAKRDYYDEGDIEGDDWYKEIEWLTEDGEFDWEAVFEAIEAAERDDDFWDWFREQYS